ncbi:MAG: 3'-5' exonuclease, partial [Clostridia bacterium]|nr:3'-5' exonuclease [Clostridia bacterium]
LTGISDDMLAGAPEISDVISDFYKFAAGCVLVGHNVQFDYKFIRYYGEQEGYLFDQKQYDTLSFAQEMLRLSNYKLNTVADYFGFGFNHHRAYEDAFVTAKIFLALARMKKGLPR